MWRDRTNLYISYRQSYAYHPIKKPEVWSPNHGYNSRLSSERQGLMSTGAYDDGETLIEMDLLPPRWVDISDQVTEILKDVAFTAQKLDRLHQQHVLPGFNDEEEVKKKEEIEIEHLTQGITKRFHECQRAIQKIETLVRESKAQGGISKGEEIMAKNIQISLAGKVQEASAAFRKKQSAYLKKLRGTSGMNAPIDGTSINTFSDRSVLETDADKSYSQLTLQKTSDSSDAVISQREREITDIAQGIIELADIFQELQTMIIDQGTMLDRIDYNVERMSTNVKAANKELNVASSYQRKGTRRRAIFLLILLVIGMFILLMLKRKNHTWDNE
ncbi:t-SNARE, partial [Erysiphe pulchra]